MVAACVLIETLDRGVFGFIFYAFFFYECNFFIVFFVAAAAAAVCFVYDDCRQHCYTSEWSSTHEFKAIFLLFLLCVC